MLDIRNHQGKFGEDYVRVLASAAGLLVYHLDLDMDGIDLGLKLPGRVGAVASPAIEVQVKSWSVPRAAGDRWLYDGLTEPQFNRLAGDDYLVPRFLFVVLVPADPDRYVDSWTDGLLLRHLCYFQTLRAERPIPAPSRYRRQRVAIPTSNVVTVRTLRGLLDPRSAAGPPVAPAGQPA